MDYKKLEKAFVGKKVSLEFFGNEKNLSAEIVKIISFSEIKNALSNESSIYNEYYDLSKIKEYHGLADDDPVAIVEVLHTEDNYYQAAYPLEALQYANAILA